MSDNASTLLAHLGSLLDETHATRALSYVLNGSASCRQALEGLVRDSGAKIDSIEEVRPEVTGPTGKGRADIACYGTAKSSLAALIEVKFDASLTRNQPNGYLDWLRRYDGTTVLIFLVPESRAEIIRNDVRRLAKQAGKSLVDTGPEDRCVRLSGTECHMMVLTWGALLDAMLASVVGQGDSPQVAEDLRQLQGLAGFKDGEERPFTMDYLQAGPDREGHRHIDLQKVIDRSVSNACGEQFADTRRLSTSRRSTSYPYGRYFRFVGARLEREVWFGVSNRLWKERDFPLWLCFMEVDRERAQRIGDWPFGNLVERYLPIELKTEVELSQVVDNVVVQFREIANRLKRA